MSEPWLSFTLSIAKSIAMGLAFWLLWSLRSAFVAGWNIQKFINRFEDHRREFQEYTRNNDRELTDLKRRMDQAGRSMSDLATEVQGMPERLRDEFIPRREADLLVSESKVDRTRLWEEVKNLWRVVNRREEDRKGHR